jgi:hypothetical protein
MKCEDEIADRRHGSGRIHLERMKKKHEILGQCFRFLSTNLNFILPEHEIRPLRLRFPGVYRPTG